MIDWISQHDLFFIPFIILARIVDVSLGTMRTIIVVRGYRVVAATIGFIEIVVWVVAVSGVLRDPTLPRVIAYGLGFGLGNMVGIMIEQRLALGQQMIVLVSRDRTHSVVFALRLAGYTVTELAARGREGEVAMAFLVVPRRRTEHAVQIAQRADPTAFVTINDVRRSSLLREATAVPPTGWRALIKKK